MGVGEECGVLDGSVSADGQGSLKVCMGKVAGTFGELVTGWGRMIILLDCLSLLFFRLYQLSLMLYYLRCLRTNIQFYLLLRVCCHS